MKIASEVKIGILAAVTLAVLIIGYKYLKGSNVFDKSKIYYTTFSNVQMLDASAPVLTRGIKVGSVIKVALDPKNPDQVIVTMDVKSDIKLPQSARAVLVSTGLLGGKAIDLWFDHHCTEDCIPNRGTIPSEVKSMLSNMLPKDELEDYVQLLGKSLGNVFDTLSGPYSHSQVAHIVNNLDATMRHLEQLSNQLNTLISLSSKNINQSLQNIDQLTTALAKNSNSIGASLNNIEGITKQLKDADAGKLVGNANQAVGTLNTTIADGKKTLGELNNVLNQVQNGNGSLTKLIKDPSLYNNLDRTSKNLDLLLQDLRLNPKRYIHVSVFGGKGEKYEKITNDPADAGK
ncbi:MAG: MlaD family protein [Saprospiraceae bacterium]|mgnify:CR=1 FL=1|nr:MlaD family protein [Saprospiraceae bacterium]